MVRDSKRQTPAIRLSYTIWFYGIDLRQLAGFLVPLVPLLLGVVATVGANCTLALARVLRQTSCKAVPQLLPQLPPFPLFYPIFQGGEQRGRRMPAH